VWELTASFQFAKHFKLEEQVAFLQKTRTGIAVGTPQRLIDLIENGRHFFCLAQG
jgi:protein CMS1